jgi:hypothetical protein
LEVVVVVAMMLLVVVVVVDLFPEQLTYHSEPYIVSLQEEAVGSVELVPIHHLVLLFQKVVVVVVVRDL